MCSKLSWFWRWQFVLVTICFVVQYSTCMTAITTCWSLISMMSLHDPHHGLPWTKGTTSPMVSLQCLVWFFYIFFPIKRWLKKQRTSCMHNVKEDRPEPLHECSSIAWIVPMHMRVKHFCVSFGWRTPDMWRRCYIWPTVGSALLVMPPVSMLNASLRDKLNYIPLPDQSAFCPVGTVFWKLVPAAFIHLKMLCAHKWFPL